MYIHIYICRSLLATYMYLVSFSHGKVGYLVASSAILQAGPRYITYVTHDGVVDLQMRDKSSRFLLHTSPHLTEQNRTAQHSTAQHSTAHT